MKNETSENPTVISLVKQAQIDYGKKQKEVMEQENRNRERIAALSKQEAALTLKIEAGKKRIEEMVDEYEALEKEQAKANLAAIKEREFTKKDVQDGKISMAEFQAQGKRDTEIVDMARARTLEGLEKTSDAIREKGIEVARLKVELYMTQNEIFGLTLNPVNLLRKSYRDLADLLDFQIGPLSGDWSTAKSNLAQSKHELTIATEGTGLSAGFKWASLSIKAARRLQHSPILPKEHIPALLQQLDEIEGETSRVHVILHFKHASWPGDPLEVQIAY